MKNSVTAFAAFLLFASGAFAQQQPAVAGFPGMPIANPRLTAAQDNTDLGAVSQQDDGSDIANRIKLRGYIDMSYSDISMENGGDQGTLGVKSVDVDFLFDFSPVTAEIHVQHENSADDVMGIEQAFVNYAVNPNFNITFGRQAQLLGYEGDEATDQHLSSRTYFLADNYDLYKTGEIVNAAHLNTTRAPYASQVDPAAAAAAAAPAFWGGLNHNYNDGIRMNFNAGRFGLAVGLYDGIWDSDSEHQPDGFADGEWGIDVQAALVIVPGLEARLGYARHNDYNTGGDDIDQLNFWVSYETGNLILAAEYSDYDWQGVDGRTWMLLANYQFNGRLGGTVRFSAENFDSYDAWKASIGPSVRITENLLTRFEYSYAKTDVYNTNPESDLYMHMLLAEGIFTF